MVTRVQLDRISSRIEQLASLINPDAGAVTVAVFRRETPEFALQRHCELRPEHGGRRVKFDHRPNERCELHELVAVWGGSTENDFLEFQRMIEQLNDKGDALGINFLSFEQDDGVERSEEM